MFTLGTIDPLLVDHGGFSGFDLPGLASRTRLIGDGNNGPHEIIQSSGIPFAQATIRGTLLTALDVATIREYSFTKEVVTFEDGNGNTTQVVVFDLTTEDQTDWWTFGAVLLATEDSVPPGS